MRKGVKVCSDNERLRVRLRARLMSVANEPKKIIGMRVTMEEGEYEDEEYDAAVVSLFDLM